MRIPRIFLDQDMQVGKVFELDAFASGHICRVLRMKAGRPLILFNGRGGEYKTILNTADNKKALVEIESFEEVDRESPLKIHLGLALSRGDRFDWAIQKAVELGVASITPLDSLRSDSIGDVKRKDRKLAHWNKLVISACEQSGRTSIPQVLAPQSCQDWVSAKSEISTLLLHPESQPISKYLQSIAKPPMELALLIGPEGGFDSTEVAYFESSGVVPVAFGPRILRTETAPVAVISVLQHLLGDIS